MNNLSGGMNISSGIRIDTNEIIIGYYSVVSTKHMIKIGNIYYEIIPESIKLIKLYNG